MITARFKVRAEHAEAWTEITREFTEATRSEPGCLRIDWSRSADDPNEFELVEAFRDGDAGTAHLRSAHFAKSTVTLPPHLVETPTIVSQMVVQQLGPNSASCTPVEK